MHPHQLLALLAQVTPPARPADADADGSDIYRLFLQSADLFTLLLVTGSVVAVAVIIRCMLEIRATNVLPDDAERTLRRLIKEGNADELAAYVKRDQSFLSVVVRAAMLNPAGDRQGMRDSAELAASEQCGKWFRKIEPLNIVGNLGPLLGLAGTVYGMVIAFVGLGKAGGQPNPADLSMGIAKALFHTLLGLMLAVPSLTVFGFYRSVVDRLCTRAMSIAAELVDMLPTGVAGMFFVADAKVAPPEGFNPVTRETAVGGTRA